LVSLNALIDTRSSIAALNGAHPVPTVKLYQILQSLGRYTPGPIIINGVSQFDGNTKLPDTTHSGTWILPLGFKDANQLEQTPYTPYLLVILKLKLTFLGFTNCVLYITTAISICMVPGCIYICK